jgi:hypothetical protein
MATKTIRGATRKMATGDGRKDSEITKYVKKIGKKSIL